MTPTEVELLGFNLENRVRHWRALDGVGAQEGAIHSPTILLV
jgi:hypothetical protein